MQCRAKITEQASARCLPRPSMLDWMRLDWNLCRELDRNRIRAFEKQQLKAFLQFTFASDHRHIQSAQLTSFSQHRRKEVQKNNHFSVVDLPRLAPWHSSKGKLAELHFLVFISLHIPSTTCFVEVTHHHHDEAAAWYLESGYCCPA